MTLKIDAKFEKNWYVVSKMTIICWNLAWALKALKLSTLIGSFYAKYISFDLKQSGGVIFHDTEEWCKIWRKTDLWFGNDMRNLANFYQSTWKISRLGLWWDPFIQSRTCISLKFTEEFCVMIMNNDAKFEEKLTCRFKIGMINLTNLTRALKSLKNLHFNPNLGGLFRGSFWGGGEGGG